MEAIQLPPCAILRAYADLIGHVFLYLRNTEISKDERFDLGDAMHNIAELIVDYGKWTSDEHYREIYLRPYDVKWRQSGTTLEEYLLNRLEYHSN